MPTKLLKYCLLACLACLPLGGCQLLPQVFKIEVQQGNKLDEAKIEQLREGLSEAQVKYLLGNPTLVDPYDSNHWIYQYRVTRGTEVLAQKNLELTFENGVLQQITR